MEEVSPEAQCDGGAAGDADATARPWRAFLQYGQETAATRHAGAETTQGPEQLEPCFTCCAALRAKGIE